MVVYDEKLLKEEQMNINSCYWAIGKQYYETNKDNPGEEYAEFAEKIAASEKKIADHKAAVLKQNGLMLCPSCGKEIMDQSVFCNFCGKRVEQPAEEPAEAPVEESAEAPVEEPAVEPAEVPEEEPVEAPAEEPAEEPAPAEEAPAQPVCAKCGAVLEPDCLFCVECGARVENAAAPAAPVAPDGRVCKVCGNKIEDSDAMFCTNCGSRLESAAAASNEIFSSSAKPKVKRCPNCGFNTTDAEVMFCIECGSKLV